MKFEHPTIQIQTPAPGHYVITGHNPGSTFVEGVGHVVPSQECYISPQVPNEALLAVLDDRGGFMANGSIELVRKAIPEAPEDAKPEEIAKAVAAMVEAIDELEDENSKQLKEIQKLEKENGQLQEKLTAEKESGEKLLTEAIAERDDLKQEVAELHEALKKAEHAKGGKK